MIRSLFLIVGFVALSVVSSVLAEPEKYFACVHAEACLDEPVRYENLAFCNTPLVGQKFVELSDQLSLRAKCMRCLFEPHMRYQITADHIEHGPGIVICRGELPEQAGFRACSDFLPLALLTEFANAKTHTLAFHVAVDIDQSDVLSWLKWNDAAKTDAELRVILRQTLMGDAQKFAEVSISHEAVEAKYNELVDGIHGLTAHGGNEAHLSPCEQSSRSTVRRLVRDVAVSLFDKDTAASIQENLERYARTPVDCSTEHV